MSAIDATARGGGLYRVFVDGVPFSDHTSEREALENATEALAVNPLAAVWYVHDYTVDVKLAVTAPPPPPPPPPVSDEPAFTAGVSIPVMGSSFDAVTDVVAMGALPLGTIPRIVPIPSPVATSQPVNVNTHEVIPGRNGGKAIRMKYSGAYQQGADFLSQLAPATPNNATHYFQYWARITYPGDLTNVTLAIKWFEAWHRVNQNFRVQWNTHGGWPCNVALTRERTYWQIYDGSATSACQGMQAVGPYFRGLADGLWHRFTHSYKPHTAVGARDGFARMWIDGVKVLDVSASAVGVMPAGGEKVWCNEDDLALLAVNDGIREIRWGGPYTGSTAAISPWTFDVDDFTWWTS